MTPARLIAAISACALVAPCALAQQRPDTTEVVVFSEMMAPREQALVVLSQGVAYRVEVVPRSAIVRIAAVRPGALPLEFRPLRDPAAVEEGISYLMVPSESGEYRITLIDASEAVRIRLIREPRETRLLAGQGRPPRSLATLGLRAVALLADFETTRRAYFGGPDSTIEGTAIGAEACLGVGAGRFRELPQLGGCLFTVGYYAHSGGADLLLVGTNPHYVLSRPGAPLETAIAANFAFGKADSPFLRDITYLVLGAGANISWKPASWITLALSPGLSLARRGGYTRPPGGSTLQPTDVPGATAIVPRLAAGLHFGL